MTALLLRWRRSRHARVRVRIMGVRTAVLREMNLHRQDRTPEGLAAAVNAPLRRVRRALATLVEDGYVIPLAQGEAYRLTPDAVGLDA